MTSQPFKFTTWNQRLGSLGSFCVIRYPLIRWAWRACVGLLKLDKNSTRDSLDHDARDSQTSVFPSSSTPGLIPNHNTCHRSSIVSARGTRTAVWMSSEVGLQLRSLPHSRASSLICISYLKLRRQSRPFVLAVPLTVRFRRREALIVSKRKGRLHQIKNVKIRNALQSFT